MEQQRLEAAAKAGLVLTILRRATVTGIGVRRAVLRDEFVGRRALGVDVDASDRSARLDERRIPQGYRLAVSA